MTNTVLSHGITSVINNIRFQFLKYMRLLQGGWIKILWCSRYVEILIMQNEPYQISICNFHGRIVEIVKNDFALPSEIEDTTA